MGNVFNATYAVYLLMEHKYRPPGGVYGPLEDGWTVGPAVYCKYEITDHFVGIYCNVIGPLAELRHVHFRAKRF